MKAREELLKEMNRFRRQMLTPEQAKILKQGLHDVLNAPTQAQLDCPYCHNMNLEEYRRQLNEDSSYIEEVKYCQVCGRKLGGK